MSKYVVGSKFDKLTVTKKLPRKGTCSYVEVVCDCGLSEPFPVFIGNLGRNHTTSCGCVQRENATVHGLSNSRIKTIYYSMLRRCKDPSYDSYDDYMGRGITVCERWLEPSPQGFINFVEDMGEPEGNVSLDRKDNSGNYSKDNCHWTTLSVQAYNTRRKKHNTSGRTGVRQIESGKWESRIGYKRQIFVQGAFDSFEEACAARAEAELKYYGFNKE